MSALPLTSSSRAKVRMNNEDILLHLCSKLDDSEIRTLYFSSLQPLVASILKKQQYWYLRTCYVCSTELKYRSGDWRRAYYHLVVSLKRIEEGKCCPRILGHLFSVQILLELRYVIHYSRRFRYRTHNIPEEVHLYLAERVKSGRPHELEDDEYLYSGDVTEDNTIGYLEIIESLHPSNVALLQLV